jgi:hypothetical protein
MKGPFYHTGLDTNRDEIRGLIDGNGKGKHYYVDYATGADTNSGEYWNTALKTYGEAVDRVTTNKNDVIHINGASTVVETSMVTLSKSRVHTVGHNGAYRHMGNGAKINLSSASTGAANIACFKNTGVRNTFTGIRFMSDSTISESLYTLVEAGEFATYNYCEAYKSSDLDDAGAAELLLNGDTAQFYNCSIGALTNETGDIRAKVLCTNVVGQLRDCYFENCLFLGNADATDNVHVYAGAAGSVQRMLMFKQCTFMNNGAAAGTPAHAVGCAAAQDVGLIFLKDCSVVNIGLVAEVDMNIWIDSPLVVKATSGVAIAAVT